MSSSTIDVLRHILDETVYLTDHSRELTKAEFIQDDTLRRAFSRSIEVIGEAAKQVPDDFRQRYSQIDWRAMAGMRDRLIHGYFSIDYDIVWDVVKNKVPQLRQEIEEIIDAEQQRGG